MQHTVAAQRPHPIFHRERGAIQAEKYLALDVRLFAERGGAEHRTVFKRVGRSIPSAVVNDAMKLATDRILFPLEPQHAAEGLVAKRRIAGRVDGVKCLAGGIEQVAQALLAVAKCSLRHHPISGFDGGNENPADTAGRGVGSGTGL